MELYPPRLGSRFSWLGWSFFWSGFYYVGRMQTWVFGDHTNKPALFDLFAPLHFWFPWTVFFSPVWLAASSLSRLGFECPNWVIDAAALGWAVIVARLTVFTQDRLHPTLGPRITWFMIGGTVAALIALRAAARSPATDGSIVATEIASGLLLLGLVLVTWLYVLWGLGVMIARRQRRHPAPG